MVALLPRVVVVTRPTELELLLVRHGTHRQARFVLEMRGQSMDDVQERHAIVKSAEERVTASIPLDWRRARVPRSRLDRFLFEPDDVVIAVGQDGLVANVAKYLEGQVVIGVNPGIYDGVLVPHRPEQARELMKVALANEAGAFELRTLAEARTSDGQSLLALNEIFVGHRTHQSARYRIAFEDREERHSSSGVVICTGTGATGWASSIIRGRETDVSLPTPTSTYLTFFVREAFLSNRSGVELVEGAIDFGESVTLTSEMNQGGVAFGDGIEDDHLELPFGQTLTVGPSERQLLLLVS
ncbi:MAG: NAD(+)/NADH kinase [Planctomycetota bacterium]|jgi:NAD kinase